MAREIEAEIDRAFEWFVLLLTVLAGILFTFLTWLTDHTTQGLRLLIGFMLSLILPIVASASSWMLKMMYLSPSRRTFLRLFSWSIASLAFIYYLEMFTTIAALGIAKTSTIWAMIIAVTIAVFLAYLFPWRMIIGRYRAATLSDSFWESRWRLLRPYIYGIVVSAVLILVPILIPR